MVLLGTYFEFHIKLIGGSSILHHSYAIHIHFDSMVKKHKVLLQIL
jgi:hypothetical protein